MNFVPGYVGCSSPTTMLVSNVSITKYSAMNNLVTRDLTNLAEERLIGLVIRD